MRDTAGLSFTEDCAYRRLLDHYYASGEPIEADHQFIFRVVSALKPNEKNAVLRILNKFFQLRDGKYHNKRADKELNKIAEQREKARRAAAMRWQCVCNADASPEHMLSISTDTSSLSLTPSLPITNSHNNTFAHRKKAAVSDPAFEDFWSKYPRKVSKQAAHMAYSKFTAEHEAILLGLSLWVKCDQWQDSQYIPYPATFLNQRRWETPPQESKGDFTYDFSKYEDQ